MADVANTPGAMPETTENGRDAQPAEREAESSEAVLKALKAERREREALAKKLKAYEETEKARADEDLKARGKFDELEKSYKAKLQAAEMALIERDKRDMLQAEAIKFVAPSAIQDVLALVSGQFELRDGKLNLDPAEFFTEFVKARPYFAKQAQPGAMKGTTANGGTAQPDYSKMSPLQKMQSGRK